MFSINTAFASLATMAGLSLVVLGIGTLLTWCWVRPIERLRCIQTTFVAIVAAWALQQAHLLPQIALGWLPGGGDRPAEATPTPTASARLDLPASRSLPQPSASLGRDLASDSQVQATDPSDADRANPHLDPQRPRTANLPAAAAEPPSGETRPTIAYSIRAALLVVFAVGAGWSVFRLILAIVRLRKLRRACTPAPVETAALLDEIRVLDDCRFSRGRRVAVLVSHEIEVPLTFGVVRPTIVLPASMIGPAQRSTLRNCLAHEWSHIANFDVAQWWGLQSLEPLLWYQPLYWILRREMRLCQDQVADHFAASRTSDAVSYAELLVQLAKLHQRSGTSMALTMNDGHSNLFRRIQLLLSENHRLSAVCRSWAVGIAAAVLIAVTAALGTINLGRAESPTLLAQKAKPTQPPAPNGETALARLRELGARVSATKTETGARGFSIDFGASWKGTDSDLALLSDVARLGELSASIDFPHVSPRAVSELKLPFPLEKLYLGDSTDRTFEELKSLPPCHSLILSDWDLSPAACRRLASLAAKVESLECWGNGPKTAQPGISNDDLSELAGLKNLKSLRIVRSPITEVGLKHLAGMKQLNRLVLEDCPALQDSDLSPLGNLDSLRTLQLRFRVSAAGLANIARLGSLEELAVTIFDLDAAEVEPLARLTHLQTLSIESNRSLTNPNDRMSAAQVQKVRLRRVPLGDAIAGVASKMPGLRNFSLQAPLDEKGLAALVANQKLQSIGLDLVEVDDRSLALISRLTGLRKLTLRGPGKLSDAGLAPLERLTQLVKLELPAAGVTDEGLSHLAPLVAMTELDLSGGKITGMGLAALGRWKELKTLTLSESPFDDAGCRLLPQFAGLETLSLYGTKITDAGLESIAALSDLISLNIVADTAVTDVGLAHLKRLKHLEWVYASGTAVSPQGVAALKEAIRGLEIKGNVTGTYLYSVAFSEVPAGGDAAAAAEVKPGDSAPSKEAAEAASIARKAILEELKQRGAQVGEDMSFGGRGVRCQIWFPESWKGTADDWKLLSTLDHPERLILSVNADQLAGLAQVHFAGPIAGIMLELQSGERLAQLDRLPACRLLWIDDHNLTVADYRKLFALAPDVQEMTLLTGAPTDGDSLGTADGAVAEIPGRMKHLLSLNVNEPLSAAGLQAVGKLVLLQHLMIKTLAIAPADVEPLARLANLQTLNIGPGLVETNLPDRREEIPVGDAIAGAVGAIPTLRNLAVDTHMSVAGLESLATLPKLQALIVELGQVDDRAVAAASRLTSLKVLHLSGEGKLSDGGLVPLEKLPQLFELVLPGQGLSDAGLTRLAPLTELIALHLSGGQFNGAGLAALVGLKQLEYLELEGPAFNDEGCRLLPQFAQLQRLNLSNSKITDAGLESIAKLSNLADLNLAGTKITDAGLAQLKPLVKLNSLQVTGTAVTKAGVASLEAAIPNLSVIDDTSLENGYTYTSGRLGVGIAPVETRTPADDPPAAK